MAKKKYNSMGEFAKACGVSRPTLSKYFNDPSMIKEVTRKRIEAVLKKTDFEPNLFARHLNLRRTRNVGILVPTMSDPFFVQVVSLIELQLREEGLSPIRASSHCLPDFEEEAIRSLLSMKVAGAIIAPLGVHSRQSVYSRLAREVPVVCFDSPAKIKLPFVGNDNRQSVSKMVQYLCRSGEPPVYFEIPPVNDHSNARQIIYEETMRDEGHEPLVIHCNDIPSWDYERQGYEQLKRTLAKGGLPGKTILCANDRFAFGAMAAAWEADLKIGRANDCDVRIAGHDDHPLSKYTCPPLTTMAQNAQEIASSAVQILLENMEKSEKGEAPSNEHLILGAELVMRASA